MRNLEAIGLAGIILFVRFLPIIQILTIVIAALLLRKVLTKSDRVQQLRRTTSDRIIAGVCGGLARYFNVDPTIIRCIWALAIALAGIGITAYIICWIAIPKEIYNT